jgi:hypothetical protein
LKIIKKKQNCIWICNKNKAIFAVPKQKAAGVEIKWLEDSV